MEAVIIIALCVAGVSLVLAGFAAWRAGGRRDVVALRADVEALRARDAALAEEQGRRVRSGYADSLARIKRAEERIARLRRTLAADTQHAIDALQDQLDEAHQEVEAGLAQLRRGVSARAEAIEQALHRRVQRLEGRALLLLARADVLYAERLAEEHDLARANDLLEEAVARVREVRLRQSDPFEEDPAFQNVLDALLEAVRAVRTQPTDYERQIARALTANEALLVSLAMHEQSLV